LEIELRAALAYSINGSAASNSAYVDVYLYSTSALITAHLSASILALDDSASTIFFSFPTFSANISDDTFFSSADIYAIFTSISIYFTSSDVYCNFIKPYSYLSLASNKSYVFLPNIFTYNYINSKKLFGVVNIALFSCSIIYLHNSFTNLNEYGINSTNDGLIDSLVNSISFKKLVATLNNASYGQS